MKSLSFVFCFTTIALAVSCKSYPSPEVLQWSEYEHLLEKPEELVPGDYKNEPVDDPFSESLHLPLWRLLTGRASLPSDAVRIQVTPPSRTLTAILLRQGTELERAASRYNAYEVFLQLDNQHRAAMETFPVVYGWVTAEINLGRNQTGLSLQEKGVTNGFVVVYPFTTGEGGHGGSATFEPVAR